MDGLLQDGTLLVVLPLAFLGGLISIVSPCVLPLIPGYIGYVTGSSGKRSGATPVIGVLLFILGFTAVFLSVFVLSAAAGIFFLQYRALLERVAGCLVILMGFVFVGQVTVFQRTIRPNWQPRTGLIGAPLLGAAFAIGWTPCVGPVLATIISLSSFEGDPLRAVVIGLAYCLGLGVPFLLVALGLGWVSRAVRWTKRHVRTLNVVGGVLLIGIGFLMLTGVWREIMSYLGALGATVLLPL